MVILTGMQPSEPAPVRDAEFNEDWLFLLEDGNYAGTEVDDTGWRTLDLPHDWSIEQSFDESLEAESGFLPGGTGWYRKHFTAEEDGRYFIRFDGVMGICDVYINGNLLGTHPYGYTPFTYELTPYLEENNTIAVRVDNPVPSSRWYSGSGIYRDVTLIHTADSLIMPQSIRINYGELQEDGSVLTTVEGKTDGEGTVRLAVLDPSGHIVAEAEGFSSELAVPDVSLWSPDDVNLYTLRADLWNGGKRTDRVSVTYGYRYFRFDREEGFFLNGEPMKLKGVCLHHDQGALGAAAHEDAFRRQITLLKQMGCNAVRMAHNPADPDFLDICMEEGILVICEAFDTWTNPKNANWYDYSSIFSTAVPAGSEPYGLSAGMTWAEADIRTMVREARNNPSVILWSIGNEILGNIGGDVSAYPQYADDLCRWANEEDGTRPVTIADNISGVTDRYADIQEGMDAAVAANGGIIGLNYMPVAVQDALYASHPEWIIYGSETVSELSSRGIYQSHGTDLSAYDRETVEWGMTAADAWLNVISRDYVAGEFVWTGFDYIGEPEPWNGLGTGSVTGNGPSPNSSYFGIIDTAGLPKDSYWFYQSQWRDDVDVLHVLPAWEETPSGTVSVVVYSNLPTVELYLNGVSLGRKTFTEHQTAMGYTWRTSEGRLYYSWQVPYEPGILEARGYDENGNAIRETSGRSVVQTYGEAAAVRLIPEAREVTEDGTLLYVRADVTDADGHIVNSARNELKLRLEGSGMIIGMDNGDASDTAPYVPESPAEATRNAYSGSAVFIVRTAETSGTITLRVQSEGLEGAELLIDVLPVGKNDRRFCWKNIEY